MNLGNCYTRLQEWDRAEECFRHLLNSKTEATQALQNLKLVHELRLKQVQKSDVFWSQQPF